MNENLGIECVPGDLWFVADGRGMSLGSSSRAYETRRRVFSQLWLARRRSTFWRLLPAPVMGGAPCRVPPQIAVALNATALNTNERHVRERVFLHCRMAICCEKRWPQ